MYRALIRKTRELNTKHAKLIAGLMTAINYAIYPALITIFAIKYSGTDTSNAMKITIGFSLVAAKELFSLLVYIIIVLVKSSRDKSFKTYMKEFKNDLFTKSGAIVVIAGLFGGPIGYSFQTISALYAGGGLAVMLVSSSTILTAIGERMFLKSKFSRVKTIGILLAGISVILLGVFGAKASEWSSFALIGILFSLFAAISWTIENLLLDQGMKKMKHKIKSDNALGIKLLSSTVIIFILILPLVSLATNLVGPSYDYLGKFFTNWKFLLAIWLIGFFIMIGRKYFIRSVELQGATMGFMWYTLSSFISPLLILLFAAMGLAELTGDSETIKSWWFWVFSILLISGIFISSFDEIIIKKREMMKA